MLKEKYQSAIKNIFKDHFEKDVKIFIFGSSIEKGKFHDIDVGLKGQKINEKALLKFKDALEESDIPYKIDVINFNQVNKKFSDAVFKDEVLWLI